MSRLVPVWLLVATTVLAQEKGAAPAERTGPPAEDAIAAAKRDFNAVKASRNPLEQPKADLPSMSAPELQTAPAMPRLLQPTPTPDPKAAKKSANWLVDAMMKPDGKETHDPSELGADTLRRDRESADAKDPKLANDRRGPAVKDDDAPAAEKRTGPEFNPLTRYMAGWMTPQDYSLLKPGMDGAAAASLPSRGDPSLPAIGADLSTLGDGGSALDLAPAAKAAPFTLPKPADNPFLQPLAAIEPGPAQALVPLPSPNSAPANTALAPVPVQEVPAKSKMPDFAKPAMDEKYFKQLKRF